MKWARELFSTSMGRDLLSVVRNELPVASKGDDPSFALGKIHGYMEAINVLTLLAVYPATKPKEMEVTYEPEIPSDNGFEMLSGRDEQH